MKGKKVLLVEDNEDNRAIYRVMLEHTGFTVLGAGDGEEGIRQARAGRPDAVLMDVGIPLIDGWEATRILKQDPTTASIPMAPLRRRRQELDADRRSSEDAGSPQGNRPPPVTGRAALEAHRIPTVPRTDSISLAES